MDSFFFRVEHDLLRSEAFQKLRGSSIKVYLVLGLHSDFGTGWAYPSIRTIARQAGLSRQTVLDSIAELTSLGIVATSKSPGRSTAYRIISQPPVRTTGRKRSEKLKTPSPTVPEIFQVDRDTSLFSLDAVGQTVLKTGPESAQDLGRAGRETGPKQEQGTKEVTNTVIPVSGTPIGIDRDGGIHVVADLQLTLEEQGVNKGLARRLTSQFSAETVAKVVLNAMFLKSQGKLQNAPGYIRAGIEAGYDLLPQVVQRLEKQRRELAEEQKEVEARRNKIHETAKQAAEEAAIQAALDALPRDELELLIEQAIDQLPPALVRRNPSVTNPFIRGKVYELAVGKLIDES